MEPYKSKITMRINSHDLWALECMLVEAGINMRPDKLEKTDDGYAYKADENDMMKLSLVGQFTAGHGID